jgi:hypothetical protein
MMRGMPQHCAAIAFIISQGNFYSGSTLITPLSMKNWARSLTRASALTSIALFAI